jgi:radical SAM superfamily enzyme YgiQ (UPF0313 family)
VTHTPIPRYDLLEFHAYDSMSVQFSRGCPFQCEFCDIIVLYGRKPRTKTPAQLLAELDRLYELGWRRAVFMVDDNFIGNKRNVKLLLKELKGWMAEHQYPFSFNTEASVDLAQDPELLELMLECNFNAVFLGIETPDADSLELTKKFQNTRTSLAESVQTISRAGLRVMAGFIIGFDSNSRVWHSASVAAHRPLVSPGKRRTVAECIDGRQPNGADELHAYSTRGRHCP